MTIETRRHPCQKLFKVVLDQIGLEGSWRGPGLSWKPTRFGVRGQAQGWNEVAAQEEWGLELG